MPSLRKSRPILVHPVEHAHQHALEIQLERNAQVEVLLELVVVGTKGLAAAPP
jgi:hypothetical protein